MKHFIDCIVNNKEPRTDGKYGLKILRIVETMYRSAETRKIEEIAS
jgi:predicted dehydrogenase